MTEAQANGESQAHPLPNAPYGSGDGIGLTKRELLAATALQGVLANDTMLIRLSKAIEGDNRVATGKVADIAAAFAVMQADALLVELSKPIS